jgi:hypothetical protein
MKRLDLGGLVVAQNSGDETGDAVDHHHGRKLSSRENVISHRQIIRDDQGQSPLVNALIMTAEKHQIFLGSQFLGDLLAEHPALRRHIQYPGPLSQPRAQILIGITHRPRLHDHARTASVWIIIYLSVFISGIIPDIHRIDADKSLFHGPADDTGIQAFPDHFRKQSKNMVIHDSSLLL